MKKIKTMRTAIKAFNILDINDWGGGQGTPQSVLYRDLTQKNLYVLTCKGYADDYYTPKEFIEWINEEIVKLCENTGYTSQALVNELLDCIPSLKTK